MLSRSDKQKIQSLAVYTLQHSGIRWPSALQTVGILLLGTIENHEVTEAVIFGNYREYSDYCQMP